MSVEQEEVGSSWVIHGYGLGGYGYIRVYACSLEMEKLALEMPRVVE